MTTSCPRCGSTDPAVRNTACTVGRTFHPWHDRPTVAAPSDDLAVRLDEKATPGPWERDGCFIIAPDGDTIATVNGESRNRVRYSPDADFIAEARTLVPALLARIRELEADCDTLWEALQVEGAENLKLREAGDALAAAVRNQRGAGYWLNAALDLIRQAAPRRSL